MKNMTILGGGQSIGADFLPLCVKAHFCDLCSAPFSAPLTLRTNALAEVCCLVNKVSSKVAATLQLDVTVKFNQTAYMHGLLILHRRRFFGNASLSTQNVFFRLA